MLPIWHYGVMGTSFQTHNSDMLSPYIVTEQTVAYWGIQQTQSAALSFMWTPVCGRLTSVLLQLLRKMKTSLSLVNKCKSMFTSWEVKSSVSQLFRAGQVVCSGFLAAFIYLFIYFWWKQLCAVDGNEVNEIESKQQSCRQKTKTMSWNMLKGFGRRVMILSFHSTPFLISLSISAASVYH